ncbi:MAG: DEAD/DEAH box helicase family protein [Candidatus Methanofastidiosia archaeon]
MIKLRFDPNLDFQIDAINSIIGLFKGQIKQSLEYTFQVVPNILTLPDNEILKNLQEIQNRNELPITEEIDFPTTENLEATYNFTVEMETGTGKTYVYLRTILELNQKYGFTKFIIVVPSVAIKEGVLKTLEITKDHFRELYENLPYTYFVYKSGNLVQIRMFAQDTSLQIMIITRDAFNKEINIIHNVHDRMGDKPIQLISQTRPIVILDEPHKMGGEASQWGISQLNPLFILRYSATHRELYNLVYKLTPYDAYNFGLVKKIEVLSITEEGDPSSKKIILEKIDSVKSGLRARVKAFSKEKGGIRFKAMTLKHGEDLEKKTDNPYYNGFLISEINKEAGYISFVNGVKIYEGRSSVDEDEVIRFMIQETIREHFERKRRLNPRGIKILSLFFINRVNDYLPENGWLRRMFEEECRELIRREFSEFSNIDIVKIHKGYFSRMRSIKSIEKDEEAYNLIMKDKERLLSLDESVEFIFSHSALREGWDNPNVFNICTLSYSTSEIKKRQEIGRGLRLPVNLNGERIHERETNFLTVVTNESYRGYLEQLQTEFREEVGETSPPVEDRRKRRKIFLKKDFLESDLFKSLWERISPKAKYFINIEINEFINKCVKEVNEIEIKSLEITSQKVRIEHLGYEKTVEQFIRERVERKKLKKIPNIVEYIENETGLTRSTILKILRRVKNLHFAFKNPLKYIEYLVRIINNNLKECSVENIKYIELDEYFDSRMFSKEIQTYDKYIVSLENNKTLYKIEGENNDGVIIDIGPSEEGISRIEKEFTQELDRDSRIKLFLKLPDWYTLETPAGKYTPDWAVIVEKQINGITRQSIYFIVETKGTMDIHELRTVEQIKIKCARRRFDIIEDVKFCGPIDNFTNFTRRYWR